MQTVVLLEASAACLEHDTALFRAMLLLQASELQAAQLQQLGLTAYVVLCLPYSSYKKLPKNHENTGY